MLYLEGLVCCLRYKIQFYAWTWESYQYCPALLLSYGLHHGCAERAGELGFFGGYYAAAGFLFYEAGEQAVLRAAAGEADVAVVGDAREEVRGALRDGVEQAEAD